MGESNVRPSPKELLLPTYHLMSNSMAATSKSRISLLALSTVPVKTMMFPMTLGTETSSPRNASTIPLIESSPGYLSSKLHG